MNSPNQVSLTKHSSSTTLAIMPKLKSTFSMMILLKSIKLNLQYPSISSTKPIYIKVVPVKNLPLIIAPTQDSEFSMEILPILQLQLRHPSIITVMPMIQSLTIFKHQSIHFQIMGLK